MGIEEVFESPAFWILGGLGIGAEILGFIIAKKSGMMAFPIWQLIILMAGTLVAAGFFALRD